MLLIHRCLYYFRIAGSDTTSTSLSYFFWELSRRADIMKKLQAELDEAMTDIGTIPSLSVLQELPYLNAFINEGKRFLYLVFLLAHPLSQGFVCTRQFLAFLNAWCLRQPRRKGFRTRFST